MHPILRRGPMALLMALLTVLTLSGAVGAQAAPDERLPPDAAATPGTNTSVGSTGQVPNVAYPQAPVATPAAEGVDRARLPTDAE